MFFDLFQKECEVHMLIRWWFVEHEQQNNLRKLINALVFSQIRYCISVYGNGKKGNFCRLQKIINYAAKLLFGRRKYDHVSDLLERLGWLGAEGMATYHMPCLTHKVRFLGEPEQLGCRSLHCGGGPRHGADYPPGPPTVCPPVSHGDGTAAFRMPGTCNV